SFFSVPFIILTLGLFMFVINAVMLELTDFLITDFVADGFGAAFKGALFITIIHYAAQWLMRETLEKK
ncbi:MAG: phage holin family protein, partial [Patescibacteria group bacterium]|nr:phage holin family protein [Patescibacteria group bacterium]